MNLTRPAILSIATLALAVGGLTACSSTDSDNTPEPAMSDNSMMTDAPSPAMSEGSMMEDTPSPAMSDDSMMEDESSKMGDEMMSDSPKAGDDAMMSTTSP